MERTYGFGTRAVHAGTRPDPTTGAIMTPVYLTSTYVQDAPGRHRGFEYARTQNPTRMALEEAIAALEAPPGARAGHAHDRDADVRGIAFASGLAAEDALLRAIVRPGDRVLACNDLYGGTYRLFTKVFEPIGIGFDFADARDPAAMEAAFRPETRLLWIETPSNPLLRVADIGRLSALARARGVVTVADNTFATPALQRPLELGADAVLHSTTKYLGGHSDVVGGAVAVRDRALADRLQFLQNAVGAVPGPLDCFLVLRGLKTLHVRMERHTENARRVARFLREHARVERVHYPGTGGMVAFELRGGVEDAARVCARTRLFACAESLGGVESLIEHPASMTHASIPPEVRRAAGFADGLIRLSVGIEDPDDLVADLERALGD